MCSSDGKHLVTQTVTQLTQYAGSSTGTPPVHLPDHIQEVVGCETIIVQHKTLNWTTRGDENKLS